MQTRSNGHSHWSTRTPELLAVSAHNREHEFEEFPLGRSSVRRFLHRRDLFGAFLDPAKNAHPFSKKAHTLKDSHRTAVNFAILRSDGTAQF
jgi:hypothetical protein